MKKLILIVSVAVFALASCKKNRTCTCKTELLGKTTETKTVIKETKKKAKDACDALGSSSVTTCTLD